MNHLSSEPFQFKLKKIQIGLVSPGEQVSEMVSPLRMMPTASDSVGESGSSSWKKDLNLSSDSEGKGPGQDQGQGPQDQEHNEAEPASRKKKGAQMVERTSGLPR